MKKIKRKTVDFLTLGIVLLLSMLFNYCNKNEVEKRECENPIIAIGINQNWDDEDIAKWGDFKLQLEINKSCYRKGEPILIKSTFVNTGAKSITLSGISYGSPWAYPLLKIFDSKHNSYLIKELADGFILKNDTVINPNDTLTIMECNLCEVEGSINYRDSLNTAYIYGELIDSIGSKLLGNNFFATITYGPNPYTLTTDTLEFTID